MLHKTIATLQTVTAKSWVV